LWELGFGFDFDFDFDFGAIQMLACALQSRAPGAI
jgi:hypothetical protein